MANGNGVTFKWIVSVGVVIIAAAIGYIVDDLNDDINKLNSTIEATEVVRKADQAVISASLERLELQVGEVKHTVDSIKWSQ